MKRTLSKTPESASSRRDILKLMGLSSAAVIPAAGAAPELVTAPDAAPPRYPYPVVRRFPLYSGLSIPKNTMGDRNVYMLFVESIGQSRCDGNGWVDCSFTNMYRSAQLAPPNYYAVERVGFIFSPTVEPGLRAAFAERCELSLRIENRIYFRAPMSALFDVAPSSDFFADDIAYRGAIRAAWPVTPHPVLIEPGVHFCVEVVIPRPLQVHGKIMGWAYLDGVDLSTAQ